MIIRTRKLSDKKVVAIISKLLSIIPNSKASVVYFGNVRISVENSDELKNVSQGISEKIINSFTVSVADNNSDAVMFGRGITRHDAAQSNQKPFNYFLRNREANAHYDELGYFEYPAPQNVPNFTKLSTETRLAIAREITRVAAPVSDVSPADGEKFSAVLNQNIDDLQRVSLDFLSRTKDARDQDEVAFKERLKKLQSDFDHKSEELANQRTELELQKKHLNDREPQHERRRLRESLTLKLGDFLAEPPEGSYFQRNIVYFFYILSGMAFVTISVFLTFDLETSSGPVPMSFWLTSIKSIVSGVGGAAFIWAGLSGLRRSTEAENDFSRSLQRYSFDMDRASWVVETLLQMNSLEKAQVPDMWLQSVCTDLFRNEHVKDKEPQSLDALAALLDATAKAKIGTNGFEFEVDKRSAKKLARQA